MNTTAVQMYGELFLLGKERVMEISPESMYYVIESLCRAIETMSSADKQSTDFSPSVWVPAVVALFTLVINIIFTVYIAPQLIRKQNQKTEMYKLCAEFFDFLTDLVSSTEFNGVPSTVRRYSIRIHLMFKTGVAPDNIGNQLEKLYQSVKKRKYLCGQPEIESWEIEFKNQVHDLRVAMGKYVGVFPSN